MVPGCSRDGGGDGFRASRSRHHRNAASVLPLPVGAWINVCRPVEIDAQPPSWAAVGASNADSNHARTGGENGASGSTAAVGVTGREILPRQHDFDRMFDADRSQPHRAIGPTPKRPDGTSWGCNPGG